MKYLAGIIIAAVIAAVGYGIWFEINDPGHGTITGKSYQPPSATQSCDTYKTATGSRRTCSPHVTAECYKITYTDGKHDGYECVTALEYDRLHIGGPFRENQEEAR